MKKAWLYCRLAFFIIVPLILIILPADYFDSGRPKCLSILLAGIECWGCGMTRGIMHLIHLDFSEAIYHHYASVIVFPLLAYVWANWFWKDWKTLTKIRKAALTVS